MKKKQSDTYSTSFSGLLTFSLGSGCISGPCKIIPKCSLSLEIWNLFRTTFLGPIIDRLPKLLFLAIDQDLWLEHNIFCLGSLYMLPACPIGHTVFWFWYFHDKKRSPSTEPSEQVSATRRKAKTLHGSPSSFKPPGGNSDAFMEAPACVEATKIDLFGCLIQSQTYGNRSLESYSLISFFEVANHPLNCRGIFLPVYSSRAKKRCNC